MENLQFYNGFKEVPKNAQREIQAGRLKGKTDINPMWRIKALTETFGPCGFGWYYKVTNKWLETVGQEIVSFVDIELYIKADGEWSQPIYGTGGNKLATMEKNGVFVSDECYKMATTDAISVACKQLGIGADVYWNADSTKYTNGVHNNAQGSNKSQNNQDSELASEPQKKAIFAICAKHKVDVAMLYSMNKVTEQTITKAQATQLIMSLKKKFGEE